MEYIIYFSALFFLLLRTGLFSVGAWIQRNKNNKSEIKDFEPFVSVIVPARNEEHNIEACLKSIANSSYPKDKFEIICVNDRSTDNTLKILKELTAEINNLKIVEIQEENSHTNLKGKAGALQTGIDESKGEILLLTDADCTVDPQWIKMVSNYYSDENCAIVAAFTYIVGDGYFNKVQALEWIYMHTMGSAGIGLKNPLGCYGNNMSIRKTDFYNVGGYENIHFSVTEDLALLKAVFNTGRQIKYIATNETLVYSQPVKTIIEYIMQHHRWARGGMSLGWRAVLFVITSAALWIGLAASIIFLNPLWFGILLIARIICDFIIISPSVVAIKHNNLLKWIPFAVFFFLIVELIVPFLIINKKVVWKGQTFHKTNNDK